LPAWRACRTFFSEAIYGAGVETPETAIACQNSRVADILRRRKLSKWLSDVISTVLTC
jgi:hypothetical protein